MIECFYEFLDIFLEVGIIILTGVWDDDCTASDCTLGSVDSKFPLEETNKCQFVLRGNRMQGNDWRTIQM